MTAADHEVLKRIRNFLCSKGYGLAKLQVQVEKGVVHLSGQVASFYEKQLAIACTRHVPEVRSVEVNVDVA